MFAIEWKMEKNTENIENAIYKNLELLVKEQSLFAGEDDNPDDLVKELSKLNQTDNQEIKIENKEKQKQNQDFDFLSKKNFFDEIYFKNSKLIKM